MPSKADIPLRIRGIYATALTRFFLDREMPVVDPSAAIQERIGSHPRLHAEGSARVIIEDRNDRQGIVVHGPRLKSSQVAEVLWTRFWDGVWRPVGENEWSFEFPACAKRSLDEIRNLVTPTLPNHHLLRLVENAGFLESGERTGLGDHPEHRAHLGRELEQRFIWDRYREGMKLGLEHVKLAGNTILLSPGRIVAVDPEGRKIRIRREFKANGRYDGLDLPLYAGDYALVEMAAENWHYRQRYFRADGTYIGSYTNINTCLEFYPSKVRYVDLELDVAEWPDGRRRLLDRPLLDKHLADGRITPRLGSRALDIAAMLQGRSVA